MICTPTALRSSRTPMPAARMTIWTTLGIVAIKSSQKSLDK